ncbi:metal resistance protein [Proteus hauseri]|uniref:metal resistance protein n=1 Tax=Proteus hauseri TaxID=183417 RepID=UPI0032DB80AE
MSHWRSGRWLVFITVMLILCCIIQRSLGAHIISERLASSITQTQYMPSTPMIDNNSEKASSYSLSTCDLSAKSLLAVPPLAIEPFFHSWAVLLLLSMAAIYVSRQRSQKKHHHPPPRIRLHLHYCILRD